MNIAHFSDSHAGGPAEDFMAYIDKRWVGIFNYNFRRKFQHDQSLLQRAVDFILSEKPDLAICTGDITSTSQPGEFAAALKILAPLRDSSIPLIYVPGNHDFYVRNKKCVQAMKDAFSYLNTAFSLKFNELPTIRKFHDFEIMIINESGPTNLLSSCGHMSPSTSEYIEKHCETKKESPRILVGHYPVLKKESWMRFRHCLWGESNVRKLIQEKKIDLSLCGHIHIPYIEIDNNGQGEVCAGSITRNACMAMIEYQGEGLGFKVSRKIIE